MLKKYTEKFCQGFFWTAGAMLCVLIGFLILKFFIGLDRLKIFKNSFFVSQPLSDKDFEKIGGLVESDKIISFDSLFTQTLAYYDTIITVLIGILGITVAGAFLYIKFGSEEKSKEYATKHIDNFLTTKNFHDALKQTINEEVNIWGEDITRGFDRIKKLEDKVDSLKEETKQDADQQIEE